MTFAFYKLLKGKMYSHVLRAENSRIKVRLGGILSNTMQMLEETPTVKWKCPGNQEQIQAQRYQYHVSIS